MPWRAPGRGRRSPGTAPRDAWPRAAPAACRCGRRRPRRCRCCCSASLAFVLFEFDERAEKIGRVDERNALAGDVVLRLAVAEQTHAACGERMRGPVDVVDAEREMM